LEDRVVTALFTIEDMVACVERELRQRHRVYPRLVTNGRMRQADADREIATMNAVLDHLQSQRASTLLL
jgi:hypothetical protein